MDLWIGMGIFLACVAGCMAGGLSLAWALVVGLFCFLGVGLHRGHPLRALLGMATAGVATSWRVLRINPQRLMYFIREIVAKKWLFKMLSPFRVASNACR